ncbi:MAG TPA: hypothetical protein VGW09_06565 [Nitrososphaeraceae archaeon]|nr:hypothetical protein [Nitrososphaeraceae archaeon]
MVTPIRYHYFVVSKMVLETAAHLIKRLYGQKPEVMLNMTGHTLSYVD